MKTIILTLAALAVLASAAPAFAGPHNPNHATQIPGQGHNRPHNGGFVIH